MRIILALSILLFGSICFADTVVYYPATLQHLGTRFINTSAAPKVMVTGYMGARKVIFVNQLPTKSDYSIIFKPHASLTNKIVVTEERF